MKRTNLLLFCILPLLLLGVTAALEDSPAATRARQWPELRALNQVLAGVSPVACAACPPGSAPMAASITLVTTSVTYDLVAAAAQTSTTGTQSSGGLERVLASMDKAAAAFRTTEANFVWDQFQKVVNDHDLQKGKVYFRRQGQEIQMAADITEPAKKFVLFSGGKIQVYQPGINQVTEYNVAKNRAELESFLVLGFGGNGRDLMKQYDVKYLGSESIEGVSTEKLQLVPKSAKVRNNVERILLWIDPARGVSVQQQFFEPSGDYRLAKYSNIELNQKISENVFKIKTDSKTRTVSPQG
ncbi:MAG TPA: outer-membrane lipoprotein carrier protein LolA [Terriglobales bacterium]|nr:outer-membrane lipoprotein carrier protein LolA [Terriglobales bacterium]